MTITTCESSLIEQEIYKLMVVDAHTHVRTTIISIYIVWTPSLFVWGLRLSKNHRTGDQDFLVKMMRGNPYRRVYSKGGKHCFLLMMYGFCSNNGVYLASLSFAMFIFFYILVRLLFQIKSQPDLPYESVGYIKRMQCCFAVH